MPKNIHTPSAAPTPKATPKRKAEISELEVVEERPVKKSSLPVVKTLAQRKEQSLYQVSVKVNSKLNGFPKALRENLEKSYQTVCYMHMFALQAGTIPKHHQTYSIIGGKRVRSESFTFTNTILQHQNLELSLANIKLLELLANYIEGDINKKVFVELKTQNGIVNPEFIELHSVRHGEQGWGFDADGCLSLYGCGIEDGKFEERVWYVKAGTIKIEDA